jgi:hypothetical protein
METPRQDRRDAASFAKDVFERLSERHRKIVKMEPSEYESAENAIQAKRDAEEKFAVKIAITLDVEGNWWFT